MSVGSALQITLIAGAAFLFVSPVAAQSVDEDAAVALAKKGNCFKCHSVAKAKKAPSYAKIALKYKDKPDAEEVLFLHVTGNPVVKVGDGDENHEAPPTEDDGELRNLIRWILTRGK